MSSPSPTSTRLIAAAATLLVIATPLVLAITTLAPLESAPRSGRASVLEEAAPADGESVDDTAPSRDGQELPGGRRNRRSRERDQEQQEPDEPEFGTPAP